MNPFYEEMKRECLHGEGIYGDEIGPVYKGLLYQRGFGLGVYKPDYYEKYGLGFRDVLSNAFEYALPLLKQGLSYLGKKAIKTAADIANDAVEGKNIASAAKERFEEAASDVFAKAPPAIAHAMNINAEGPKKEGFSRPKARKRVTSSAIYNHKHKGYKRRKLGRGLLDTYPVLEKLE